MSELNELLSIRRMVQRAFVQDLPPEYEVASQVFENDVDDMPMVHFTVSGTGGSSSALGVWPFALTVNALGRDWEQTEEIANEAHRVVTSWERTRYVAGFGGIRWVENVLMFSDVIGQSKVLIGKPVNQLTASFNMSAFHENHFHNR